MIQYFLMIFNVITTVNEENNDDLSFMYSTGTRDPFRKVQKQVNTANCEQSALMGLYKNMGWPWH